jgi:hypothetical protein
VAISVVEGKYQFMNFMDRHQFSFIYDKNRYQGAHAFSHFKKTQHPYSMELETKRVWDYFGDG